MEVLQTNKRIGKARRKRISDSETSTYSMAIEATLSSAKPEQEIAPISHLYLMLGPCAEHPSVRADGPVRKRNLTDKSIALTSLTQKAKCSAGDCADMTGDPARARIPAGDDTHECW